MEDENQNYSEIFDTNSNHMLKNISVSTPKANPLMNLLLGNDNIKVKE